MSLTTDELDLMIDRVRDQGAPSVPLHITCAEVFYEFADEMSDETFAGLEAAGQAAIEQEGQPVTPEGKPLPEALAGFCALVGEQFIQQKGS